MENIPSGSEILLHSFALLRASRAVQIFFLEFGKDDMSDLGDKFADGGAANQQVIL